MFEAGISGNPRGRPKGCCGGRLRALAALDRLLARKKHEQELVEALEVEFHADPVKFFKTLVMPLLPREGKLSMDREGVIQWRSLIGAGGGEEQDVPQLESGDEEAAAGERAGGADRGRTDRA